MGGVSVVTDAAHDEHVRTRHGKHIATMLNS